MSRPDHILLVLGLPPGRPEAMHGEMGKPRKMALEDAVKSAGDIQGAGGNAGKGAALKMKKKQHLHQHSLQQPKLLRHSLWITSHSVT